MSKTPLATVAKTGAKSAAKRTAVSLFSILAIFGSIGALVWAFSGPPPGCTPASCPANPFKIDFTNSRVGIGLGTKTPTTKLEVGGTVTASTGIQANWVTATGAIKSGSDIIAQNKVQAQTVTATGAITGSQFCIGSDCKSAWASVTTTEPHIHSPFNFGHKDFGKPQFVDTCNGDKLFEYQCKIGEVRECIDYAGAGSNTNFISHARRPIKCGNTLPYYHFTVQLFTPAFADITLGQEESLISVELLKNGSTWKSRISSRKEIYSRNLDTEWVDGLAAVTDIPYLTLELKAMDGHTLPVLFSKLFSHTCTQRVFDGSAADEYGPKSC